jgi:hypothetical protein
MVPLYALQMMFDEMFSSGTPTFVMALEASQHLLSYGVVRVAVEATIYC